MVKEFTDEELYQMGRHLLNISQDLRFGMEFEFKKHKDLVKHLKNIHNELTDLGMMLIPETLTGFKYG